MLLSVCFITKNEEQNIYRALSSIKDIADEIIVLDSNSSDKTVEIAQKFNSRVYSWHWNNNFSNARNKTIEIAKGKWILILDADEEFIYNSNFRSCIDKSRQTAYALIRQEVYRLKNGKKVKYPVALIRLFRNSKKIKFSHAIHERIDDNLKYDVLSNIKVLKNCYILHHIHKISKYRINSKQNYYLELLDKELIHSNIPWYKFQKAKTLIILDNKEKSLKILEELLSNKIIRANEDKLIKASSILKFNLQRRSLNAKNDLDKNFSDHRPSIYHFYLGNYYFSNKKFLKSLFHYCKLRTTPPKYYKECMYLISYINKEEKSYKIASCFFRMKFYRITLCILLNSKPSSEIYYLLTLCYLKLKKVDRAKKAILKAHNYDESWEDVNRLKKILYEL